MGGSDVEGLFVPKTPKYDKTMTQILQAQAKLAPEILQLEERYQPKYQALQAQMQAQSARDQMKLYQELQPQYSQLEDAYTTATQQNQMRGLQERAPGYIQAFQKAQGTAGINRAMQNYAENTLGSQLASGFQLSPEEQRGINQQTLQGFAGRGTALGNQANLASVLNRYQYTQDRKQQALQQASGIGQYLTQQAAPALQSFYQQPMYAGAAGGQSVGNAMASQQQAGPQYFNPESPTGVGSIYGAYNTQMQYQAGMAQANAAQSAGMMGMIGGIAGGALGGLGAAYGCWVAREVYGDQNPAWLMFREWLFEDAPKWLYNLYMKYGERFAAFIRNKPTLKALIRKWMDSKICA